MYGLGRQIQDDDRGTIWRLLGLSDGTRTVPVIIGLLQEQDPTLEVADIRRAVRRLQRLGIVEDAAAAPPAEFSAEELVRYSRNLDFFATATLGTPRSTHELQSRLKKARVTILGIGGVGSATASSLAAAGIGHLRIVDSDRVETSNLSRQLLFGSRDVGRLKVEVAAERLRDLNPHVTVVAEAQRAEAPEDLPALVRGCDLFVLGADQPHEILLWTNDAAVSEGVAWLENSYDGPRCAIALFVPGRTPCLRCLQHHLEGGLRARGLSEGTELFSSNPSNPVLAPTAGVAGHFGALQALYFLTGLPTAAEGRLLHLNLWRPNDVRIVAPPYWAECPACGRKPTG
ncbi:MAG: ThiF family adenylyltransferase [Thermoplasmata archaeon]